jgi:hypothetical protein
VSMPAMVATARPVHVQVLTSCRLGAITGTSDKLGTGTPAPGLGGDHSVLQPRMNEAIPREPQS